LLIVWGLDSTLLCTNFETYFFPFIFIPLY
jgi:hypothetical protein